MTPRPQNGLRCERDFNKMVLGCWCLVWYSVLGAWWRVLGLVDFYGRMTPSVFEAKKAFSVKKIPFLKRFFVIHSVCLNKILQLIYFVKH